MILTLTKFKGQPAQCTAEVRRCTLNDLAAVFGLQNAVRAAMPRPELFVPSTEQELAEDLKHSLCLGAWADGALIAYFILRYCGEDEHNYANFLDVPRSDWKYWANADSAAVHPAYCGNGLQKTLYELAMQQRDPTMIGVGCTVSPDNAYSLRNAEAVGFRVHCRREMYGGHDRYVMERPLAPLPGEYRHFKGGLYRVEGIARHSETEEEMVVYRKEYGDHGLWVRPVSMWFEHVDRDDYHGPRFYWAGETQQTT